MSAQQATIVPPQPEAGDPQRQPPQDPARENGALTGLDPRLFVSPDHYAGYGLRSETIEGKLDRGGEDARYIRELLGPATKEYIRQNHWDDPKRKNTLSDITDQDLKTFATTIVTPPRPQLVAADAFEHVNVMDQTTQITVMTVGESSRSSRGDMNYRTSYGKPYYIDLKLGETFVTGDFIDRRTMQITQPHLIPRLLAENLTLHHERVDKYLIDTIAGVTTGTSKGTHGDPSGNTHPRGAYSFELSEGDNMLVTDDILDMQAEMANHDRMVDTILMSWKQYNHLRKEDVYKSSEYFQSMMNWRNIQMTVPMLYGLRLLVTTRLPTGSNADLKVYMFDSRNFLCCGWKEKDSFTQIVHPETREMGGARSSWFGCMIKDPSRCIIAS